jgi:hypothetical protein
LFSATDRCSDQSPEGDVRGTGSSEATRCEGNLINDKRARLIEEVRRLGSEENP